MVGVPHKTWGETVVAVVSRNEGYASLNQQELLQFCDDKLSKVMLPKHIHFIDEPLPRSTKLKVQKQFAERPRLLPESF